MTTTVRYFAPLVWQGTTSYAQVRQASPVAWSQQSVSAYLRNVQAVQWFQSPTPVNLRKVSALQWAQDASLVNMRRAVALQWTQDVLGLKLRNAQAVTWTKSSTRGVLRQASAFTLQKSSTQGALRQISAFTLQKTTVATTKGGLTGLWALIQADAKQTILQSQLTVSAPVADTSKLNCNTYVTVAPTGALLQQYSGTTKLYYNRVDINNAFLGGTNNTWKLGTIASATTIRALIPQINTQYGLTLDPTDVVDGPVAAGATKLQLVADPNSYVFNPGTSLYLMNATSLAAAVTAVNLAGFDNAAGQGPLSYPNVVLSDAPYAYYRLNETSGTVAKDSSGNARNGTYTGALTLGNATLLTHDTAKYPQFPGSATAYVDVTAAKNFCAGSQWTFEAWVNVTSYSTKGGYTGSASGPAMLTDVGDTGSTSPATGLELSLLALGNTQQGYYYWPADNVSSAATGTPMPVVGTAVHIVFTYNAGTVSMYKNGALIQSFTGATAATIRSFLRIGAGAWVGGPMNGMIGEVALYTKALSAARIQVHYNSN
jgi:hypothetical protein